MKKTILFLGILLSISTAFAAHEDSPILSSPEPALAPCNATFTFVDYGGGGGFMWDFGFFPDSIYWGYTYDWDFGDGNSDTSDSIQNYSTSHTYGASGIYTACLTVTDPSGSCIATWCDTVYPGGMDCIAVLMSSPTGLNNYDFNDLSESGILFEIPLTSRVIDFGTGIVDSSQAPDSPIPYDYTFPRDTNAYNVCLMIETSLGCKDTTCQTVTVPNIECEAKFSATSLGNYNFAFTDSSTEGTNDGLSWSWDFGDGNTSTAQSPMHTYSGSGTYNVCLTVNEDELTTTLHTCTSTFCISVTDTSSTIPLGVSGELKANTAIINNAIVYLIAYDSVAGTLTALDSQNVVNNSYNFTNVPAGSYLVKGALLPSSAIYSNYLPTYLGDELFWNNASDVVVSTTNVVNPDLNLIAGVNPGGPGFIGGLVSQGANKKGDPLENISVLLLDINDQAVTHTVTDVNGSFAFDSLAYGTYKVIVEVLGKTSNPIIVTINEGQPSITDVDFEVNMTTVDPTTSIDEFTFGELVAIYPNPATNVINIEMDLFEPIDMEIELMNLMGQTIQKKSPKKVLGNQLIRFETNEVPNGIYLLQIRAENQRLVKRIIIGS